MKKILFIDDNPMLAEALNIQAADYDYEVVYKDKVSEFLREFDTGEYEAALIDYRLGMKNEDFIVNGDTLVKMLPDNKTKVFIYSVYDKEHIERKMKVRQFSYLSKDTPIDELFEIIKDGPCHARKEI